MFTVANKQTGEFFAGFGSNKAPLFTADKSKAWSSDRTGAKLQASCLYAGGINVQQKPVSL
jgi:hypothetical protein